MTKKSLLDSLKNTIGHKPTEKLTDDIKQALDKYIQRHYVSAEEDLSVDETVSFYAAALPSTAFDDAEELYEERAEVASPKPSPSIQPLNQAFPGSSGEKRKAQKESQISYAAGSFSPGASLEEHLRNLDESFSASLLKLIDAKGMKDSECYRKAGIDRRHFSKMRSDSYHPSKSTVLALCIALSLSKSEASALLEKAGYALSKSSLQDQIVEFFLVNKKWDIDLVNEALYKYDQPLLGF